MQFLKGNIALRKSISTHELFKYLKYVLMRSHVDPEKMVGMSFDGVSSMKNLAKLIKSEVARQALYGALLCSLQQTRL